VARRFVGVTDEDMNFTSQSSHPLEGVEKKFKAYPFPKGEGILFFGHSSPPFRFKMTGNIL